MSRRITKLLCANRGEIAIRVFRAATELGIDTVAIYSYEDRVHLHRYKADQSFIVGTRADPVGAYLDIEAVIEIARENDVEAIHPGYGFLSEKADFAEACRDADIRFIGPSAAVLTALGDKVKARKVAIECGVPVIPGTEDPVKSAEEVERFVEQHGLPVIVKAAYGGGGRGMRILRDSKNIAAMVSEAQAEAEKAFGSGEIFVERYLEKPRHIEIQVIGDHTGEVRHLFERDCSVQRRHQKLIEMAPAVNLDPEVRERLFADAVKIARHVRYTNAGTVEFLVTPDGRYYFIEVNPRIQVEHTVTEQVTGIDLVQAQIRIEEGATLDELDIDPKTSRPRGYAIQCRVTAEDPTRDFLPDTGRVEVYRTGSGLGIRLDGGSGYSGARISAFYDPLLVKVTGSARTFESTMSKLRRSLAEFRVRGVKTNIPFLRNVLVHPRFHAGEIDTTFVDTTPELFEFPPRQNRAQKILRYLGDLVVNGPSVPGMQPASVPDREPLALLPSTPPGSPGWRERLERDGPEAFARAIREHNPLLITDTTWRDAHQSLLATRVRTRDLVAIAPATAELLAPALSLEMWGGATFDVALRFLRECPWRRLEQLRELVPNIPFQMLLRGANAVGYTSYPDNVIEKFIDESFRRGIDIFRVFDSLNDMNNMRLAAETVLEVGGVLEGTVCYTGDVSDPRRTKYTLAYYRDIVGQLVELGVHTLAIKDMAGLLKPRSVTQLVEAIRSDHPDLPIHVHTHDTAGNGVSSMLAAAKAGADIVDLALPSMSGLTSQPSMGALVAALEGDSREPEIRRDHLQRLDNYWEDVRMAYAPFESGIKSGSTDVYEHEMPGGQYTNLKFQAQALGLTGRWTAIKHAYAAANRLLGDLIKVTPSSKVVGDLAQFMVQNDLDESEMVDRARELSFPESVVDFMRGSLGQPYGGFPEPLRAGVLKGEKPLSGRAGDALPPYDFDSIAEELGVELSETDLLSYALYPKVFRDYLSSREEYHDLSVLPTRYFLLPMKAGEEIAVEIEHGKTLIIKLEALGELNERGERAVFFELNGQSRVIQVADRAAAAESVVRERATSEPGSLGAPMPGEVTQVLVKEGERVEAQQPLVALSAMKLETNVQTPIPGTVKRLAVQVGDLVEGGDLLAEIEPI